MTSRDEVIRVEDLRKTYRMGSTLVEALRGVTFSVERGEFLSVMGPSGSGKSTLLNLIGALDRPTSGRIFLDGLDITKLSEKELAIIRRKKIGFVFQFFNLIPTLTAIENVELPMVFSGLPRRERKRRASELLELVGLSGRERHKPGELSGGEQQRVAIARALANDPSVILADEPTGNLDTKTGEEVVSIMERLSREEDKTVIVVTHDPEVAKKTSRIIEIRDGTIVT